MHIGDVLDHLCCQNALFSAVSDMKTKKSAEGQTRTVDTGIFSAVLYHLSYLGAALLSFPRPIDVKPLPLCRFAGVRQILALGCGVGLDERCFVPMVM